MGVYPSEPAEYSGVTVYAPTAFTQGVTVYPAAADPFPPIPDISNFTGIFSLYGIAPGWQQEGEALLQTPNNGVTTSAVEPYLGDYPGFAANGVFGEADLGILSWTNQAPSPPSTEIAFSAYPKVHIETPYIVSGAGTAADNGTYLYQGVVNDCADYLKGSDKLRYDAGDSRWELPQGASPDYTNAFNLFYPQGLTWSVAGGIAPAPTVAMSTAYADQAGWIDSVAADNPEGAFNIAIAATNTVTVFVKFRVQDTSTAQTIIATDRYGVASSGIRIFVDANFIRVQQKDSTGALTNEKRVAISANTWYLLTAVFDRTQAAANQTKMWLNGSTTGVVQVSSDDVSGEQIYPATDVYNNDVASYYDGDCTEIWTAETAFGDTIRQETQTRIAAQYPIVTLS